MVDFAKRLRPKKVLHLDYETRSRADLKVTGAHRYAIDPSAEILLCAASWDDSDEILLWVNPKYRTDGMMGLENARVLEMVAEADLVFAHNAPFEQAVTWGCGESHGFKVQIHQWRCTMAMARTAGLPPSLEMVAEALGLSAQKDRRGKALIKLFCEPQKDGEFVSPRDKVDEWIEFGEYCRQDVKVEKAVHKALRPFELKGAPLETFLFDLRMNQRGIPVNVEGLKNAQRIITSVQADTTVEFNAITGLNPTQREKVREMVRLPDMVAETVEAAIKGMTDQIADLEKQAEEAGLDLGDIEQIKAIDTRLRILKLYQNLSYAAIAKIQTMLDCVCPDGRVRGCHTFHGTGPGRWSARLIQPQNFKKTPKWMRPIMHDVYKRVCEGWDAKKLSLVYGEPLELISGIIRHFIHGAELLDGDYSAIQARIILWLARQDDMLKLWAEGKDVYKFMASHIYGVEETRVDSDQREVGKRVVLGCGFQMGPPKFKFTCEDQYGLILPLDLCERGVAIFRKLHSKVVEYWYYLNNSAKGAITSPGTPCGPFLVQEVGTVPFLLFKLPSGRHIAYPHPKIEMVPFAGEEGGRMTEQITYWGQMPLTSRWGRIKLYGGKLAENITMGVEADIMAYGSIVAESRGMPPFTLIHDQSLAERANGRTAEEYGAALATKPDWATGLPVKVDAKYSPYFSK